MLGFGGFGKGGVGVFEGLNAVGGSKGFWMFRDQRFGMFRGAGGLSCSAGVGVFGSSVGWRSGV